MFWEKKRETKVEKLCHNKNCGWILWWIPGVILEWQKKIGHLLSQHLPLFSTKCTKYPFWKLHKIHTLANNRWCRFSSKWSCLDCKCFDFRRKIRVCFVWAAWTENIFFATFHTIQFFGFWTNIYLVSWNCLMKILIMWPNIELSFEKKKDWKYYFYVSLPKWSVQRPLTLGVISKQYSAVTKPKSHISYDAFFNAFL